MSLRSVSIIREIMKGLIILSLIVVVFYIIHMTKNPWWSSGLLLPAILAYDIYT
jgi:hypothetical protein